MVTILEFLSGIGDAITTAFDFIINLFKDFISFLKLITMVPDYLVTAISWIPNRYMFGFLLLFSVVILYKILGREG